jgi:hypothetical protein
MKNIKALLLALTAATSLSVLAQPAAPSPQQPGSSPQATSPPGSEVAIPELRPVTGELVNKLDSKIAKTGDSVVLKTTEKATIANGVEIPKGSKLVGHVTDVQAQGTNGDNSRVTIQFDQAELKGGQSLPIRTVIQSLAPPAGSAGPGGTDVGGSAAGGPPATGSGAAGGSSASASHPSTSATPAAGASPSAAQPGTAGQSESPQNGGGPAAGTIVARNGNVAIRTTAIPGVLIAGTANGQPFSNAAGALLGAKQNVHLDGGTMMVVAVVTAPAAVGGR